MKTLREYIDLLESIEQGVSEGKKLDRLARKFVPGAASRQITDKVKDELATHLIAKDAGEDGDAELNKKDMRQTARNIDRYNKFAREKGVAEGDEPDAALEETQQAEPDPVARVERLARELQGR